MKYLLRSYIYFLISSWTTPQEDVKRHNLVHVRDTGIGQRYLFSSLVLSRCTSLPELDGALRARLCMAIGADS